MPYVNKPKIIVKFPPPTPQQDTFPRYILYFFDRGRHYDGLCEGVHHFYELNEWCDNVVEYLFREGKVTHFYIEDKKERKKIMIKCISDWLVYAEEKKTK